MTSTLRQLLIVYQVCNILDADEVLFHIEKLTWCFQIKTYSLFWILQYLTHSFCKQRFAGSVPTVDINLLWSCHGKRFCRVSVVHFLLSSPPQYFNLKLSQFGPYRLDYSKTGRSVSCNIMQHMLICVKCLVSLLWRERLIFSDLKGQYISKWFNI